MTFGSVDVFPRLCLRSRELSEQSTGHVVRSVWSFWQERVHKQNNLLWTNSSKLLLRIRCISSVFWSKSRERPLYKNNKQSLLCQNRSSIFNKQKMCEHTRLAILERNALRLDCFQFVRHLSDTVCLVQSYFVSAK